MSTPDQIWAAYRNFVYQDDSVSEQVEFEAKRAFFAGSEAVFKLIEECHKNNLRPSQARQSINTYRNMNRTAAMETIPDDEQEETLE